MKRTMLKTTWPKQIIIALVIGLICSFGSLLYKKSLVLSGNAPCYNNVCPDVMVYSVTTMRGFPLEAVRTYDTGEKNESTDVVFTNAVGNWLIYSAAAFIPLALVRRK